MEIKRITGIYNAYGATKPTAPKKTSAAASAKNTDRVEFGFAAAIKTAKAEIASAVNADAAPQEIVDAAKAAENFENFSSESLAALIIAG